MRAEYVVNAKIDLVSFIKGVLLFDGGVTRTYQEGIKTVDHPWHVYSCPEYPKICVHLAFARHIMANPLIISRQTHLFEGRSQYERFDTIFWAIVDSPEHRDKFASLGMLPANFGTHSIQKSTTTHVSTGSTTRPLIVSIYLRANWAMPGVLSRYIKYENAGDRFVGKCVPGRSQNNKKFGTSLSYWDFSADGPNVKATFEDRLHSYLRDCLPVQAKYAFKIFAVHKMAVAAIAYYRDYLTEHLHPERILRSLLLWNNTITFADWVVVKYPGTP